MKLSNKQYDIAKWIVQAFLPALVTFIGIVGKAVNWEYTELAMTLVGAFMGFLGTTLGISSASYHKGNQNE